MAFKEGDEVVMRYDGRVSDEDLVCKDCMFKGNDVSACDVYPSLKPPWILTGGGCVSKEVESSS